MAHFIESLESRTFLSADPGLLALQLDGKALIVATVAAKKVGNENIKIITNDLKALDEIKAAKLQLKTFDIGYKQGLANTSKGVVKAVALIRRDVIKGVGVATRLARKPGNVTLEAKLAADITTLQTDASTGLATITTDLASEQNSDSANLTALASAFPTNGQLSTDASTTVPSAFSAAQATISQDANTVMVTDVANIVLEAQSV